MKPVSLRPRADADIDECAAYIIRDNPGAALRFLDAIQQALATISQQPAIGSLRYAHLPLLDGLRMWVVPGFENYLVLYIERTHFIDIVR
ncbi:MAG: type II toxin-antitoxin system RelE/ParE family toxin, partial [Gammaproteobacteria bacterium]